MIRINFDVTSLSGENLTGIGVYTKNLIQAVSKLPGVECSGTCRISRFKKRHIIRRHTQVPLQVYVPVVAGVLPSSYQIFHGPDFRVPMACYRKKVVTIHDMIVFQKGLTDEKFAERGMAKLTGSLRNGRPDQVIVDSICTKDAFLERFPEWTSCTSVVYVGIDHIQAPSEALPAPHPFPYMLFVGTVEKRKNVDRIIGAFEHIASRYPDLRIMIVGGKGWEAGNTMQKIAGSPVRERIIYKGFVSNQELVRLYQHALCVAYPSLYEGFGIPILEAMQMACPVITSNIGAMKEVSGEAALHVDPYSTESIAEGMVAIIENETLRKQLVRAGLERVKTFTWQQCAEDTMNVYKKLL
jgi:alpha-1,3-rhamnosyl/mannosyltransferase